MLPVKGYAVQNSKTPLTPYSFERRDVGANDVLIDIKFCGVCHSDIHQARNEWGGSNFPMVPGHEIVGIVTQIGSSVKQHKVGDKVGVGCLVNSCRECRDCLEGLEQFCAKSIFTYNGKDIDGTFTQGGYSSKVVVNQHFVVRIPNSLPLDGAAPLLCAGITTYSPLHHWKIGPGSRVAILGLGGLGHMGVKIAHAMGANVTVLSHSRNKQEDAERLGANAFYPTSDSSTFEKLQNSFDFILNTVSADIDWNQYLNLLDRDGTMVVVGIPEKAIPIHAFSLLGKRRRLSGSPIGGIQETQEMLDFCGKHGITSDIEVISMDKINEAFERVIKGDVRFRFVIDMKTL